jgi:hypothetical protein
LKRPRTYGFWIFSLIVLAYLFWTDPDRGDSTKAMIEGMAAVGLAFTVAHIIRKVLFDYVNLHDRKAGKPVTWDLGLVVLAIVYVYGSIDIFNPRTRSAGE